MKKYEHKGADYRRLIGSARWRTLRNSYLSQYPLCEDCLVAGRTRVATVVHHIKPIEDYIGDIYRMRELAYSWTNLRALCDICHTQAHINLKSKSKASNIKRKEQLTQQFIARYLGEDA